MRLWSLHPTLLDRAALVACWREGLLAQAVLAGRTKGYLNHPQLERFRACPDPLRAVATYLRDIRAEATARGYRFDETRVIAPSDASLRLRVTSGQLELELEHLRQKVRQRAPEWEPRLTNARAHPLFDEVPGPVESWERATQG